MQDLTRDLGILCRADLRAARNEGCTNLNSPDRHGCVALAGAFQVEVGGTGAGLLPPAAHKGSVLGSAGLS